MAHKSTLKKPQPLAAAIIAYMRAGEERGGVQCAGLRMRYLASGQKIFFYRYCARNGALHEIRREVGPLTLAKARDAVARKRLEREQGKDSQLGKWKEREQATRERLAQHQATYTLENLVNEYIDEVLKDQKRGAESARILRQDLLPVLGHRPALQITRRELHDVMLPRQAVELLKSRQGIDQVYVFPSPRGGRHVAQKALGFAQYYARQRDGDKPAPDPIEVPWTVHDTPHGRDWTGEARLPARRAGSNPQPRR